MLSITALIVTSPWTGWGSLLSSLLLSGMGGSSYPPSLVSLEADVTKHLYITSGMRTPPTQVSSPLAFSVSTY